MVNFSNATNCMAKVAALAITTSVFALGAQAQEVTLRAQDGSVNITGELKDFDGEIYTIDSTFGPLRAWSVSLWGKRRAFTEHVEKLSELLTEKTEGQFRLNISYGGLSPSRENLDGVANGAFEMAQFCAGYHPDKNPSITVLELPFLGVSSMEQELAVSQAVYAQYNIAGVGSPPTSLEAFKAMTVRATGGTGTAVTALGATSVNIPAPQTKEALSNNEINAVAFAPHAHMAFGTINSAQWWTTNLNPGTANCPIVVSTEALNDLPQLSRDALLSSVDESLEHFISNYKQNTLATWDAVLAEKEIIQLTFSEGILNSINEEVAGKSAQDWIAEKAELGLPAQALYDLVLTTLNDSQTPPLGN